MRLVLVAVGRLKAGPERLLAERYGARIGGLERKLGFGGLHVVEVPESRARRESARIAEEGAAILARLGDGPLVAFDEAGTRLTSAVFAQRLASWRDGGAAALHLIVGGPDGLAPAIRSRAALTLAFGAMTLPHQLVRVLVVEQLYRAMTILAGHPYHRS